VLANEWQRALRTGQLADSRKRIFVFNAFRDDPEAVARDAERHPALRVGGFLGAHPWTLRDRDAVPEGCVCQSAWEIHSAFGCLHACDYCHVQGYVNLMLNLEEFARRLPHLFALCPSQQLFKYDNQTDTICFEPEYGASELLVPLFAREAGRYLMLYTKSDNVDHLLPLQHRGKTIISWSLSPQRTCVEVEKGAPGMAERIAAAQRCQDAGYTIRFRFSPIVPLDTWPEDLAEMIRALFEAELRPDSITMDVLGWMRPQQMAEAMDVARFDPRFAAEVEEALSRGEAKPGKHFFSERLRGEVLEFALDEIRRARPDQRISICVETPAMWDRLGPKLAMRPDDYVCCCGPNSVPGHPMLGGRAA
jgi:spore photoproduct lyase